MIIFFLNEGVSLNQSCYYNALLAGGFFLTSLQEKYYTQHTLQFVFLSVGKSEYQNFHPSN